MKDNFSRAMAIELRFEGGKVDDPQDPGGRTNQGITQRVYAAWRGNNGLSARDVFLMEDAERDAIYRLQYAEKIKFDSLPAGIDLVMLDGAINSGPVQAVKWVQRALGAAYAGKVDGVMGEATFRAIAGCNDLGGLIQRTLDRRRAFLRALTTFRRFGRGWTARVDGIQATALAWAAGLPDVPAPAGHEHAAQKADIADAKRAPKGSPGAGTAGFGGTIAAASVGAHSFVDSIKEQLRTLEFISQIKAVETYLDHAAAFAFAGLGISGIVFTAAGGAYYAWARRRAASLHDALDTLPVGAPA